MITTLDKLEDHVKSERPLWKWRKMLRDVKVFAIIFVAVYAINTVVVNFELFVMAFSTTEPDPMLTQIYDINKDQNREKRIVHHAPQKQLTREEALAHNERQKEESKKIQDLKTMIAIHKPQATSDLDAGLQVQNELRMKLSEYNIEFNRLPPTDRLIIPSIGVDVPLVDPDFTKPINELTTEDFDAELYKGVVKYPTTPYPSDDPNNGNTMIVGHTSFDYYLKNPYGSVFAKIPQLKEGDEIQVVWKGKMYKYKVVLKEIVNPHDINDAYTKYTAGNHITLLGCYPIGSDKNRLFVVAEYIPETK